MKVILVFPHGGISNDQGAIGKTITERRWVTLFLEDFLIPKLKEMKIDFLTVQRRTWEQLPDDINKLTQKGDFILSTHLNAASSNVTGSETLYYEKSIKSEIIAKKIQKTIIDSLQLRDRGLKPKKREDRGGRLLKDTKEPCVLTELFFLTNENDLKIAESKKEILAENLAKTIKKILS